MYVEPPIREENRLSGFCSLIEDYVQIKCITILERTSNDIIEKNKHCGCSYKECRFAFSNECELFMQVDFSS